VPAGESGGRGALVVFCPGVCLRGEVRVGGERLDGLVRAHQQLSPRVWAEPTGRGRRGLSRRTGACERSHTPGGVSVITPGRGSAGWERGGEAVSGAVVRGGRGRLRRPGAAVRRTVGAGRARRRLLGGPAPGGFLGVRGLVGFVCLPRLPRLSGLIGLVDLVGLTLAGAVGLPGCRRRGRASAGGGLDLVVLEESELLVGGQPVLGAVRSRRVAHLGACVV